MAEELKTLREAALALDRVSTEISGVDGKLNLLIAGVGVAAAVVVGSTAYLYTAMNQIQGTLGRLDERTSTLVTNTAEMSRTLTEVRDELVAMKFGGLEKQDMPFSPDPAAFKGWRGVEVPDAAALQNLPIPVQQGSDVPLWIYSADEKYINAIRETLRK